jgi:hypothetical protein
MHWFDSLSFLYRNKSIGHCQLCITGAVKHRNLIGKLLFFYTTQKTREFYHQQTPQGGYSVQDFSCFILYIFFSLYFPVILFLLSHSECGWVFWKTCVKFLLWWMRVVGECASWNAHNSRRLVHLMLRCDLCQYYGPHWYWTTCTLAFVLYRHVNVVVINSIFN